MSSQLIHSKMCEINHQEIENMKKTLKLDEFFTLRLSVLYLKTHQTQTWRQLIN